MLIILLRVLLLCAGCIQDSHTESEEDMRQELVQAERQMRKQAKLQSWLLEKEKREMAKLEAEQQALDNQRKVQSLRDAKFFRRAKAVKDKLRQQNNPTAADTSQC